MRITDDGDIILDEDDMERLLAPPTDPYEIRAYELAKALPDEVIQVHLRREGLMWNGHWTTNVDCYEMFRGIDESMADEWMTIYHQYLIDIRKNILEDPKHETIESCGKFATMCYKDIKPWRIK